MKNFVRIFALLFVVVTNASASTYVGFGNYIPSEDDTYGILSALTPRIVAVRMGETIIFEPSISFNYSYYSQKLDGAGPVDTFDISSNYFGFTVKALYPVIKSQSLTFYGFAGLGFASTTEKTIYQQTFGGITKGDYDKESSFGFILPLGAGLQLSLSKYVSLAFDYESGISYQKISGEEKRGNTVTDLGSASQFDFLLTNQVLRFILFFGVN